MLYFSIRSSFLQVLVSSIIPLIGMICMLSLGACSGRLSQIESSERDYTIIDSVLKKPHLKVLDIGNSYTNDATALLSKVVDNCGVDLVDMCLYKLVRSSASFKNWCNVYADSDTQSYSFRRIVGGETINLFSKEALAGDGSLFREVLSSVEWDIIILHQVSAYAPYYELWDGVGDGGYLDVLLSIIKQYQPKAQIGFLLVHSYWDGYKGNLERSSLIRWQKIADSVRQLQMNYGVGLVIPYGTAVENLRSSSLNNGFDLTRDGTHCGYGLCQYTAACCYYEALIAPRVGISCLGYPSYVDVSGLESKYPCENVTDSNVRIAQKAAILAVNDMFHCNNPD